MHILHFIQLIAIETSLEKFVITVYEGRSISNMDCTIDIFMQLKKNLKESNI